MRSILFQLVHAPIGYLYMRLRYGRYHVQDFDSAYHNAGMVVIWMPDWRKS